MHLHPNFMGHTYTGAIACLMPKIHKGNEMNIPCRSAVQCLCREKLEQVPVMVQVR